MQKDHLWLGASAGLAMAGLAMMLSNTMSAPMIAVFSRILLGASLISFLMIAFAHRERGKVRGGLERRGFNVEHARSNVCFADVAANEIALNSLKGLVDFLQHPEKYAQMGARIPRGVLLYGPPGTGKTLLAKALAGEAGVPYYALSGSDFVELYVGVGASRVRELFAKARKAGKCVIFIDEIDAMGKKRDDASSDEREQTLNALLAEMSGFQPSDGRLVLAATNRVETLDPALTRPGRFDRQIEVGLPGCDERLSILRLHAKNKPLAKEVDLADVAHSTSHFSGASLESLLNEAAILAAQRGAAAIENADLEQAYLRVVAGEDRPGVANAREKRQIAIHEAGHAVAAHHLQPDSTLARVSILPSSKGMAGYNLVLPRESVLVDREQLICQIRVLLAGRAAEMLICGKEALSAGAANDLARAGEIAAAMVSELGMAGEPYLSVRALHRALGGGNGNALEQCKELLKKEYETVTQLLAKHISELDRLTDALVESEVLSGEKLNQLLSNET